MSAPVLAFVEAYGVPVFPIRQDAKKPLTIHGFKDASRDPAQIERWAEQYPRCNWAMPTGALSGFAVLDVDIRPDQGKHGDEVLRHLEDEHGVLPETAQVLTPSGGRHYWFRTNGTAIQSGTDKLGTGLDVKAEGGYVLIPPSEIKGRAYTFEASSDPADVGFAELPTWLSNLLEKKPETPKAEPGQHGDKPADLLANIMAGNALHDSLRDLAARWVRLGMGFAEICSMLEAAMRGLKARDERWHARFDAIPGLVNSAIEKFRSPGSPGAVPDVPLRALSLREFLAHEFKPRQALIGPITTQALGMIHGYRGGAKTWAGLSLAIAAASGGEVFGWKAPRQVRNAYLDGEMAGADIQSRIRQLSAAIETSWDGSTLRILTPDLQVGSIPDLATAAGQVRLEAIIGDAELIWLDNLSAWVRGQGEENAAESWLPMLDWLLRMRAQGRSVIVFHHSGKTGLQRGTSKREDVLDFVIGLRKPADYQATDGARFELHFEKSRGVHGDAVAPFEAKLITDQHGCLAWTTRTIEVATMDRVVSLARDGLSQKDIAIELALNKSTVSRTMKKAEETGLLPSQNAATKYATRRG